MRRGCPSSMRSHAATSSSRAARTTCVFVRVLYVQPDSRKLHSTRTFVGEPGPPSCVLSLTKSQDSPRLGLQDWQEEWDGVQVEYHLGKNLKESENGREGDDGGSGYARANAIPPKGGRRQGDRSMDRRRRSRPTNSAPPSRIVVVVVADSRGRDARRPNSQP